MSAEEYVRNQEAVYENFKKAASRHDLPKLTDENKKFLLEVHAAKKSRSVDLNSMGEGYIMIGNLEGLRDHSFRNLNLRNTVWFKQRFMGVFTGADLRGAKFIDCSFIKQGGFEETDLRNAEFFRCQFSTPRFSGAQIDGLQIERPIFGYDYKPELDDADQAIRGWIYIIFDWSKVRFLSTIPLFAISWATMLFCIAAVNIIGFANIYRDRLTAITDPVPTPSALVSLGLATAFLAVAATIYRAVCPDRIQEVSETTWVEIQGKPRLQYYAKRFPYRFRERAAILVIYFFGAIGLIWSVALVGHRVSDALCYLRSAEQPEVCHADPIEADRTSALEAGGLISGENSFKSLLAGTI